MKTIAKREARRPPDNEFLFRIINNANTEFIKINKETMLQNLEHATIDVDGYGRLRSSLYIPAIYYTDPIDQEKIVGFGF